MTNAPATDDDVRKAADMADHDVERLSSGTWWAWHRKVRTPRAIGSTNTDALRWFGAVKS